MHKPGFFLVQTSIYCALFSLLLALLIRTTVRDIIALTKIRSTLARTAEINAAMHRFMHDFHQASSNIEEWQELLSEQIIWKLKNESIGWLLDKGNFIRYQGNYNSQKKIWSKKTQSVAVLGVKSVTFDIKKNKEKINGLTIVLCDENSLQEYRHYFSVRNRTL
jgi:hypothetical protein